jgi:hypothetical protein
MEPKQEKTPRKKRYERPAVERSGNFERLVLSCTKVEASDLPGGCGTFGFEANS